MLGGTKGTKQEQGFFIFFYGKGNENYQLGTGFFCTLQNSISQLREQNLLTIILIGRWCDKRHDQKLR
jgi:hypothetical protein